MKTLVQFISEQIEVPCTRRGRPSYRWTTGYYVVNPAGAKVYPPVLRSEAYDLARQLFGDNIRIVCAQ
jgi:hypothetical protein